MKKLFLVLIPLLAFASLVRSAPSEGGTPDGYPISFRTFREQFDGGDLIVIREVFSTSSSINVGDTVLVRGEYQLQSHSKAMLLLSLTTNGPSGHQTISGLSRMNVDAGTGAFELQYTVEDPGELHVSFYPRPSGSVFGGVYFAAKR